MSAPAQTGVAGAGVWGVSRGGHNFYTLRLSQGFSSLLGLIGLYSLALMLAARNLAVALTCITVGHLDKHNYHKTGSNTKLSSNISTR